MLPVFAEHVKGDGGGMQVVRMAGVVARLIPTDLSDAEGRTARRRRILNLDKTTPGHQFSVVLPDDKLGRYDGLADDTLQL